MTHTENRSRLLIAGTLGLANLALLGSLALTGLASPAMAQGAPIPAVNDRCPAGYDAIKKSGSGYACYPKKGAKPAYAHNGDRCKDGYVRNNGHWCIADTKDAKDTGSGGSTYEGPAADRLVSYGTITKANRLDRCPIGHFSKSDMTTCTTRLSPAPKSRKKTGPCNSNEIDEWGLYCTADAKVITREQAEQEADRDFNAIYSANGAKGPTQTPYGDDTTNSAPMVAAYGRKGAAQASNAAAASSTDQSAAQTTQCQTGNASATGSAIGGAVGGNAGAVLGGMLGGLGKKKKPAC